MTTGGKGGAARASRPVIHRLKADALIEMSHDGGGETVWGVYSPEMDRQLQEIGNLNEETGEYSGWRDGSDADEDRWSVRLHVERTAQQEREHYANLDSAEAARASRSGTRWTNADHMARGKQRLSLWFEADVVERLDAIVDRTGAPSRREAIEILINAAHAKRD